MRRGERSCEAARTGAKHEARSTNHMVGHGDTSSSRSHSRSSACCGLATFVIGIGNVSGAEPAEVFRVVGLAFDPRGARHLPPGPRGISPAPPDRGRTIRGPVDRRMSPLRRVHRAGDDLGPSMRPGRRSVSFFATIACIGLLHSRRWAHRRIPNLIPHRLAVRSTPCRDASRSSISSVSRRP